MAHWQEHLPVRMLEVDYERTVLDLPAVARELIDWIGLPGDDRCVEFHTTARPIRTASVSQVRQPVYARSVDRWQNYEPLLPELFERLGPS